MIPDNPHPWRAWWLCRIIHNFHLRMTRDHRVLDNLVTRVAALEQFNLNYEIVEPEPMRSDVPR